MIRIPPSALRAIVEAAEQAYPEECCGLLVGRRCGAADLEVRRVMPSPNLAAGLRIAIDGVERPRFEIDPQLFLDLRRALVGGEDAIIGLYHSHPDGPAQPSARDLESAWDRALVWVITAVHGGRAIQTTAHVLDPAGRQFREIPLRTTDWGPDPVREGDGLPDVP